MSASKKKVIVLGSTGMLGHTVATVLSRVSTLSVFAAARSPEQAAKLGFGQILRFDAANGTDAINQLVAAAGGCHAFINCIAVLKPDIDEQQPKSVQNAIVINTFFPHELAVAADKIRAQVIHVSTDGVFTGASDTPYLEGHHTDASDAYGKSKMLGEPIAASTVSIRTSFVGFDPLKRKGLLEWFLAQPEGAELTGYTNHIWNGVTALQFSHLCAKLLTGDQFAKLRKESPIHHFAPNSSVSKYELLEIFRNVFEKNVTVRPVEAPGSAMHRALGSRYKTLRELAGHGLSMETAVAELKAERRFLS